MGAFGMGTEIAEDRLGQNPIENFGIKRSMGILRGTEESTESCVAKDGVSWSSGNAKPGIWRDLKEE